MQNEILILWLKIVVTVQKQTGLILAINAKTLMLKPSRYKEKEVKTNR